MSRRTRRLLLFACLLGLSPIPGAPLLPSDAWIGRGAPLLPSDAWIGRGAPLLPSDGSSGIADARRATDLREATARLGGEQWRSSDSDSDSDSNRVVRALPESFVAPEVVVRDEDLQATSADDAPLAARAAAPRVGDAKSVERALDWLARRQRADGGWDSDADGASFEPRCWPAYEGRSARRGDVGTAGMATLAFLAVGNTHREGPHKAVVRSALRRLMELSDAGGRCGPRTEDLVVDQAIATLALVDAYESTRSAFLGAYPRRAVEHLLSSDCFDEPAPGTPPDGDDVAARTWTCMALGAARSAGLDVPDDALRSAIERVAGPLRAPAPHSASAEGRDAASVVARRAAHAGRATDPDVRADADRVLRRTILAAFDTGAARADEVYFRARAAWTAGGASRSFWLSRFETAVAESQRMDGDFAGSWDDDAARCDDGGRVYATALAVLCLTLRYR